MTSLAVIDAYSIAVFLHVTAVVVGFGATFVESITFPVALKLSPRHLPYVHRLHLAINQWFAAPALVVILLTGLYQTEDGNWDFGEPWLSASMTIVLVLGGLLAYLIVADRRLVEVATRETAAAGAQEGEVEMSADYQRRARMTGIAGAVAGVLVVVAIFLMVTKPGL